MELLIGGAGSNFGSYIIAIGILLYSLTAIFSFVTLPVEINASSRAMKMLSETGVLSSDELSMARKVLYAAALTYIASLVTSILYLFRFLIILSHFRKRD